MNPDEEMYTTKAEENKPMDSLPDLERRQLWQILRWTVILHVVVSFFASWAIPPMAEAILELAGALCLLIFVCFHGWYRYGLNKMLVFFAITAIISWSTESLSVATGFPFGHYHYTDLLGDKIGQVPIMIFPAYFFIGYLSWTMGNLFCGHTGGGIQKKNLVLIPLASALIMVMWNVCFDPIMSTIEGNWIWEQGGMYFGVPLSNFAGWFLTVYLIYQAYAIYLYRSRVHEDIAPGKCFWYWVPILYATQGLPYFLYPFFRTAHPAIYQSMSLITVFTMFSVAFLNYLCIRRLAEPSGAAGL